MTKCKVCDSQSKEIFQSKVLNRYLVSYYQCITCKFIQTDSPFWLEEAYSSAITKQDIGLINRNLTFAPIVSGLIKSFFNIREKYLDYGGGYGMFVRIMRDKGFNYYRFDTYCDNIFAEGFEDDNKTRYELLTAFEVFEHLEDPLKELEKMLNKSTNIFFSTELQPFQIKNEKDWWYLMPETGQHIALYSIESLKYIAKKYNLNLYTNNKTFHLLTSKKINRHWFKIITNWYVLKIINIFYKGNTSLLLGDYNKIVSKSGITNKL